jgi:serine/threonine protein kinase/GTPase SAR1 family protein
MMQRNDSNLAEARIGHQLGNYRLVGLLGRGGFASIFLGEHLYLKRLAAIKVLRTVLVDEEKGQFLEEARLLANLSHSHIVRVLEFAVAQRWTVVQNTPVQENIPFLVMDYAPGGNLRAFCPVGTYLPLDTVVNYIKQAASALQYAHDRNIIHRDIKPENFLLNEQREIMLSDFGLALFAASPASLSLQGMAGTPHYMAPEHLRGKPQFASDQYALAVVAYEWLCGQRPFGGEDAEMIMHHISSHPPRLRSKNPSISQSVENVILKALAKDPQQRYPDVQVFARALELASRAPGSYPVVELVPTAEFPPYLATLDALPSFSFLSHQFATAPAESNAVIPPLMTGLTNEQVVKISSSMQRNRQRMIQKVCTFWVTGVLAQSLDGVSFITPELRKKQDAVANPWLSTLHQSQDHAQEFAPNTPITEIYDQAGGELLILGEAGSGKTTLLLELARNLLDRAAQDEALPIPVVFTLSSWGEKQLPLDQWLIEELHSKYQVPRLLGEYWVRSEMLLPLLDGLDEVNASVRSACVVAINTYRNEHGLSPLVVCSRLTAYLLYPPRVLLRSAVVVQPLTDQQIEQYLRSTGENHDALYQILRNDRTLQQLATTPLMLNTIASAYLDKSPEALLKMHHPEERYQEIFRTYVEQMLRRYHATTSSLSQQLIRLLAYLAIQMQRRNQTVFYLEQMQPDWIENIQWRRLYRWFAVMLPGALIGALTGILCNVLFFHAGNIGSIYIDAVYGIVMGYMLSGRRAESSSSEEHPIVSGNPEKPFLKGEYIRTVLFVGLTTFFFLGLSKLWIAGLVNGIALGILSLPLSIYFQKSRKAKPQPEIASSRYKQPGSTRLPIEHVKNGILAGLACGLTSVLTILVSPGASGNSFSFLLILLMRDSLRNALLGTLLSLVLVNNDGVIHRAEVISWSWKWFWQSMRGRNTIVRDVLMSIIIGVIFASKQLFQGSMNNVLSAGVSTGLLVILGFRLIYALLQGVSSRNLDNHHRYRANEGLRRSLFHGLLGGVIGMFMAVIFTIITSVIAFVLSYGPYSLLKSSVLLASLNMGFSNSLLLGPIGGLLAGLLLGGLAFLQYGILRFILWRAGSVPLNLLHLLEDATTCILLHKVGGGYLFIHRFLLEYFASLQRTLTQRKENTPPAPEPLPGVLEQEVG